MQPAPAIAEPAVEGWSKQMGTIHPCGHIEAQHLYHDSGELILDLSKCRAVVEGQPDAAELAVQMAQYLAHAVWAECMVHWQGFLTPAMNARPSY